VKPRVALALVRPFTLLAPAVGACAGAVVAAGALGVPLPWAGVAAACLSAAAATGASNAWNQAHDAPLDRVNKPERPIPAGLVGEGAALGLGDLLAVLALGLGALASGAFLACVAVGLLCTWIYSAPPLRTKRHLVGALGTIALSRGLLVPVAGWAVVAAPTSSDPWALGAVAGCFVLGAAATKDFSDVEGDRAHGCRTLPVLLGPRRAARVVAPFLVLPFLGYPLLGALGLLAAPLGRLVALGAALALLGGLTAWALLADPDRLARGDRNHPAWRGMYLLLLGSQVGTALVYALP
jgi:chlorophyll/bacteriochlorophyll a synthase